MTFEDLVAPHRGPVAPKGAVFKNITAQHLAEGPLM